MPTATEPAAPETEQEHDALAFCAHARAAGLRTISHLQALLSLSSGEVLTSTDIGKVLGDSEQNTNYILTNLTQLKLVVRSPGRPAFYAASEEGLRQAHLILFGTEPEPEA